MGGSASGRGGLPEPQVRGAGLTIFCFLQIEDPKGRDQICLPSLQWSPLEPSLTPLCLPKLGPKSTTLLFCVSSKLWLRPEYVCPQAGSGPPTWESVGS